MHYGPAWKSGTIPYGRAALLWLPPPGLKSDRFCEIHAIWDDRFLYIHDCSMVVCNQPVGPSNEGVIP